MTIDISHYIENTKVLGPYNRSALWVRGCCFSCDGCIAKEMNVQEPNVVEVHELVEKFSEIKDTEGITISGGEPFLQAKAIYELIKEIRKQRDYGVIVYTGFKLEELEKSSDINIQFLLKEIDILIDGRYVSDLDDGRAYRGSSNQRIIQLTKRYKTEFEKYYFTNSRRNIEIDITEKNVYMVGVPSAEGLETWREFKRKAGCESGRI